jgi:hypothetical protein
MNKDSVTVVIKVKRKYLLKTVKEYKKNTEIPVFETNKYDKLKENMEDIVVKLSNNFTTIISTTDIIKYL